LATLLSKDPTTYESVIIETRDNEFTLIVFREGARVKNRVTPIIDTNKTSHPLDERQSNQPYKSICSIKSI
jgi:hypothetical protein